LTGGTQTPFLPGSFNKTVEIGTVLAPDASSIVTDITAVAVTAVGGALTRSLVNRAFEATTQTETAAVRTAGVQTEVTPVVVVESPELVARLSSVEESNIQLSLELAKARAKIAHLEEAVQVGNDDRKVLEQTAEALISRGNGAKGTITRLKEDLSEITALCHDLGARSKATVTHLFNLLTEKSEPKAIWYKKIIDSSVDATLKQVGARLDGGVPPLPSFMHEQLLEQAR